MQNQYSDRKFIIGGIILLISIIYITKLFDIQVLDSSYKLSADNNSQRVETQYPARGNIFDRNGRILVENQAAYDLMVIPRLVQNIDTLSFCSLLNISESDFIKRMNKAKRYSRYKPSIFLSELIASDYAMLQEILFDFPGFYAQSRTLRNYPFSSAANVLGFVSEVSDKITKADEYYQQGDHVGAKGLEKFYENELRGEKGRKIFLVDVHNRVKGSLNSGRFDKASKVGKDITSTIDIELQDLAESLMEYKVGSVVAIEPFSGEILALASSPTYDPNILIGRKRSANYKKLVRDTIKPLYNRATLAQYPPGSTFKLINALVGLQENIVVPQTKYSCEGVVSYPIVCSHNHHSPVNLLESIELSCNPYHYKIFKHLLENKKFNSIEEAFTCWQNHLFSFGLGKKLNLDFPSQSSGLIPGVELFDRIYSKNHWKAITVRSLSIGQGEILLTPLQMANMTACIANRGFYYDPHIVRSIKSEAGDSIPEIEKHFTSIDEKYFEPVIEGMRDVFVGEEGTARWYENPVLQMCGKTGTAENPHGDNHSIFVAFAPVDTPRIAISVVVETAGFGSTYAAPIACLLIEKYLTDSVKNHWWTQKIYNFKPLLNEEEN